MEQIILNLVAGALGGAGSGKALPQFDLGNLGNIIAGLVGGGMLGQVVTALWPQLSGAMQSGNLDAGSIVAQIAGGGVGGAVLQIVVGAIRNAMSR